LNQLNVRQAAGAAALRDEPDAPLQAQWQIRVVLPIDAHQTVA
jgi:hypothetical protein